MYEVDKGKLICLLFCFCQLTQERLPWEEGGSVEELPPLDWSAVWGIVWISIGVGGPRLCGQSMKVLPSIAVIKDRDQGDLEKSLIWGSWFQRAGVCDHCSGEHGSRQADRTLEHLRAQAERVNREWHGL